MQASDLDMSSWLEADLEAILESQVADPAQRGAAKAELAKRQRHHEIMMAEAEDKREINRKNFEERMAREQRDHAEKLAVQQLVPAKSSVTATRMAAISALLSTVAALATVWIGYATYTDQHHQQIVAGHPLVDFYTEDSDTEPTVGIQIQNEGLTPVIITKVEYFVDGQRIRDTDEANSRANLTNPEKVDVVEFQHRDPLAAGEKVWLYSRPTADKGELGKFTDFVDNHFTIGAEVCSPQGQCSSTCSTTGKCGKDYPD